VKLDTAVDLKPEVWPAVAAAVHSASCRGVWVALVVLLGLGIRLIGLFWGQGYAPIGPGDSMEAYRVAVDYATGEGRSL